jgi:dihydroorotase
MLDILIRDGTVVDPADKCTEQRDIGIRGGKIVDLNEYPERHAEIVVDASGCCVTPGLIDFHAHLYTDGTERGVYPESTYFPNGVTTAIDGGSAGVANYPIFHNTVMATSKVRIFADLNICSLGLGTVAYQENIDPNAVNVEKIKYFFDKYGDSLQALKLRQSQNISRSFRQEPLH